MGEGEEEAEGLRALPKHTEVVLHLALQSFLCLLGVGMVVRSGILPDLGTQILQGPGVERRFERGPLLRERVGQEALPFLVAYGREAGPPWEGEAHFGSVDPEEADPKVPGHFLRVGAGGPHGYGVPVVDLATYAAGLVSVEAERGVAHRPSGLPLLDSLLDQRKSSLCLV